MIDEKIRLQDIKAKFGWPVDRFKYGIKGDKQYFDDKSEYNDLPESLIRKVEYSKEKIEYAKQRLGWMIKIPWVYGIFITGSVASLNANEEDDIDIWLIVGNRRIWLTRAIDFLYFFFTKERRLAVHGSNSVKVKNKFCFNLYTTIEYPKLQKENASWAIQFIDSVPIHTKSELVIRNLILNNSWISKFFPSWYSKMVDGARRLEDISKLYKRIPVLSNIFDVIEYFAGVLMLLKSSKRLTLSPKHIFVTQFTTWGSERILSKYD